MPLRVRRHIFKGLVGLFGLISAALSEGVVRFGREGKLKFSSQALAGNYYYSKSVPTESYFSGAKHSKRRQIDPSTNF